MKSVTGSTSSSAPASIAFSFAPSCVYLAATNNVSESSYPYRMMIKQLQFGTDSISTSFTSIGGTHAGTSSYYGFNFNVKKSSDGKTIYMYSSGSLPGVFNNTTTYYFIGVK